MGKQMKEIYGRNGYSPKCVEKMRNYNVSVVSELGESDRQVKKLEESCKIEDSKYNPRYKK